MTRSVVLDEIIYLNRNFDSYFEKELCNNINIEKIDFIDYKGCKLYFSNPKDEYLKNIILCFGIMVPYEFIYFNGKDNSQSIDLLNIEYSSNNEIFKNKLQLNDIHLAKFVYVRGKYFDVVILISENFISYVNNFANALQIPFPYQEINIFDIAVYVRQRYGVIPNNTFQKFKIILKELFSEKEEYNSLPLQKDYDWWKK